MNMENSSGASRVKRDVLASIVVFLVALPLCMGIAIASGAPIAAGLLSGIVGGLLVGVLAGSPLQVSGPAAGLTVIVYEVIQRHGLEVFGLVVLVAGALQLVAGVLKLGQWFRAVSPAVIQGMLAGIGVLIFASQFHVMFDNQPKGSGVENLKAIPQSISRAFVPPEVTARSDRQFRTEKLKQIGELHRQQDQLREQIAKLLPESEEEWASTDGIAVEAMRPAWVDQQAEITRRLETAAGELMRFAPEGGGYDAEGVQRATTAAVGASRSALEDLQRDPAAALESQQHAASAIRSLLAQLKNHHLAAMVGVLTILLIVAWQSLAPKKVRVVPAPLVAVVLVTILTAARALPVLYVEVPENLFQDMKFLAFADTFTMPWGAVLQMAVVLAVVASAETLLCATAVDQMHQGQRTQYDKELAAQGIGNMVCGLVGALPMTGVIVRSSANVQAGATTRLSAILHGLWLLLFVAVLGSMLRMIPTASLAAILVYTGYKLVNLKAVRKLWQMGKGEVAIYAATLVTIVVADLLTGVILGVVLSAVKLLYTFSHLSTELELSDSTPRAVLSLDGTATFVSLPKLAAALERVPQNAELHVDLQHLAYVDHACLELLMTWARQHQAVGGRLVIDWDSLHARFGREPFTRKRSGDTKATPQPGGVVAAAEPELAV